MAGRQGRRAEFDRAKKATAASLLRIRSFERAGTGVVGAAETATTGNVGSAAAQGATAAAGLTGSPQLAAVAAALQVASPALDAMARNLLPDLTLALRRFGDISRAAESTKGVVGEAAAFGVELSNQQIASILQNQIRAEELRSRSNLRVEQMRDTAYINQGLRFLGGG